MNQLCSATHCIYGEAAGVTEHIQDGAATGILFEETAVVALIHEEARLLAAQPVDMEAEAILYGHIVCIATDDEAVLLSQSSLEGQSGLALVEHIAEGIAENGLQSGRNLSATHMHSDRMGLNYGRLSVDIHDKTWHLVALAMNKAVGAVVLASGHTDGLAHLVSYADAALPESGVNRLIIEGEYAYGDRANLPMANCNKLAVGCIYAHYVALLRLSLDMMYRS